MPLAQCLCLREDSHVRKTRPGLRGDEVKQDEYARRTSAFVVDPVALRCEMDPCAVGPAAFVQAAVGLRAISRRADHLLDPKAARSDLRHERLDVVRSVP